MKKYTLLAALIAGSIGTQAQTLPDAIKLTQSERFEDASSAFKKLVTGQASAETYYYSADNFLRWEELDSAQTTLNQGISAHANNLLLMTGKGKLALYQNNKAEAEKIFANATSQLVAQAKTFPKDQAAIIYCKMAEGFIYSDNKNPDQALTYLAEAEKLNPKDPEIFILRGDALLQKQTGDASESILNFEKAYELDKSSRRALLRQANLYRQVNNFEAALDLYNKSITMDPNFAPAYRERAELYYRAGKIQNGIEDYQQYLALNNSPSARGRYASFLYVAKDYKNAIAEINKVMAEGNTNPILYRVLAYCQFETKDFKNGLVNMETFRASALKNGKPKFIPLDYSYYGKLLAENGKDSLAIAELNKAIELDPNFVDGYSDIAGIYLKAKDYPQAAKFYQKKIDATGKGDYNDYNFLGRALYNSKDYVGAEAAFRKVAELIPNLTIGYYWAALSRSKQETDPDNPTGLAKELFEKVVEVGNADPERSKKDIIKAYEYLGFLYFYRKDYACAKSVFTLLKGIDPTNEKTKALEDKNVMNAGDCDPFAKATDKQ